MIFRLGSIPESDGLKEGTLFKVVKQHSEHFSFASIVYTCPLLAHSVQMSVPRQSTQSSNESTKASPSDQPKERKG